MPVRSTRRLTATAPVNAVFPTSATAALVGASGAILKTEDSGAAWTTLLPDSQAAISSLRQSNATTFWATGVTSVRVTATVADANATLTINGTAVSSGAAKTVDLNGGPNAITVVVTAQDGATTKTYAVIVTRQAASSGAKPAVIQIAPTLPVQNTVFRVTVQAQDAGGDPGDAAGQARHRFGGAGRHGDGEHRRRAEPDGDPERDL